MGGASRKQPLHLAEKLLRIRVALGLSQSEMLQRLGVSSELSYTYISRYEQGTREPPLHILLNYARLANVWVDVLIDDNLDLPEKLPVKKRG